MHGPREIIPRSVRFYYPGAVCLRILPQGFLINGPTAYATDDHALGVLQRIFPATDGAARLHCRLAALSLANARVLFDLPTSHEFLPRQGIPRFSPAWSLRALQIDV